MKVIFLDKDGVLNSDEFFDNIENADPKGKECDVDIEKIKLLKQVVIETDAQVVVTASARYTKGGQKFMQLLRDYQIFADKTPFIENKRGIEIKEWLSKHPEAEDFVILDDEIFDSYDEELMKKLIKISDGNGRSFGEGLMPKDINEIVQRLGKKRVRKDVESER